MGWQNLRGFMPLCCAFTGLLLVYQCLSPGPDPRRLVPCREVHKAGQAWGLRGTLACTWSSLRPQAGSRRRVLPGYVCGPGGQHRVHDSEEVAPVRAGTLTGL